ncbi:uncharacterized protein Fot_35698 [Forsythia ovata]|uniref:DUF1985 domain-containing protein n=1 Tax=Forsythia ovata TaxID=205694 RepID=A0ABD1SMA5_9LAMI
MFTEPIQITLDKHVHWYVGLNKQGKSRPICVTHVSKGPALVNDKIDAVELGELEREIETDTLSFKKGNDYWQDLEILPENDVKLQSNDDNEVDENIDDYQDGMDINADDQNVESPAGNSNNIASSYSFRPEFHTLTPTVKKQIQVTGLMEYFVDRTFVTESKVSSRSTLPKLDALDDEHKELFLNSCFGKLYNVRSIKISPELIHNMVIRRVCSENADELWICLGNEQAVQFSFFEFALVTSFKPGDEVEYKNKIVQSGRLFEKYFGDGDKITPSCLYEAFNNEEDDMDDKYS